MATGSTEKKKRDSITVVLWILYILFWLVGFVIVGRIDIVFLWDLDQLRVAAHAILFLAFHSIDSILLYIFSSSRYIFGSESMPPIFVLS